MKYSKYAPKWLVDSHKAMMRELDESESSQKLHDQNVAPAKRAIEEKMADCPEKQEPSDWIAKPTPTDVFYGDALNDVAILDEIVKKENDVWMRPIWEMLWETEDDFDDAGRRLYSASVSGYKQAGSSDRANLRRIIEEQASRLAPAGDGIRVAVPSKYLADEVPSVAESGESVGKLTIISSNVPEMRPLIESRVDSGITKKQEESREKAKEAAGQIAAEKEKEWIAEYKKVKRDHPEWKVGVIWGEVASRLEDTPYKGSAPYMQSKIKIPPD